MHRFDVKSFYYSVVWKFDLLDDKMGDDERYKALKFLNEIIKRIFERYTRIINEYRILGQSIENEEYIDLLMDGIEKLMEGR